MVCVRLASRASRASRRLACAVITFASAVMMLRLALEAVEDREVELTENDFDAVNGIG